MSADVVRIIDYERKPSEPKRAWLDVPAPVIVLPVIRIEPPHERKAKPPRERPFR